MRFSAVLLLAGVASASLLRRQDVPQCALTCIENADTGSCSATDNNCLCHNSAFIQSTTSCITSTCSGSDLAAAEQFAQEDCEAVGVTLTASSAAASASASASGSGSSSASGSSSGSAAATTTAASTTTGTSAAASSASSASSSSGANPTGVPVLAAAAALGFGFGFAAFAL